MMVKLEFDASDVEPTVGYEALPAGDYFAAITGSDKKSNKAGTGSYLQLTFEIADGSYKGRLLWVRLNLDNPNEQAVEMARRELAAICTAVGSVKLKDSSDLHDRPLVVKVVQEPRADNKELVGNKIVGYQAAPEDLPF